MEARKLTGPEPDAYQLSLRIRHPAIDPAEISRELEIEAEHSFRAGDSRRSRSALAAPAPYTESYWLGVLPPHLPALDISFPGDQRSQLAQQGLRAAVRGLTWALSLRVVRFLHRHAEFLKRIGAEGGQISVLIALPNSGETSFSLPPQTGRFFASLGVTLEFEISDP
jgi:hypothetical protein